MKYKDVTVELTVKSRDKSFGEIESTVIYADCESMTYEKMPSVIKITIKGKAEGK